MSTQTERYAFSVDDYYRMAAAGVFSEDDRIELIEGDIVAMSPIGSAHGGCVKHLNRLLSRVVGDSGIISVQDPIRLNDYSEPEPDIAVLRLRDDFYKQSHPCPADVLLLIEVSETTLKFDRDVKLPLYTRAGIPEVWIVNLIDDVMEVYRQPGSKGYAITQQFRQGQTVSSEMLPEIALLVDLILG